MKTETERQRNFSQVTQLVRDESRISVPKSKLCLMMEVLPPRPVQAIVHGSEVFSPKVLCKDQE